MDLLASIGWPVLDRIRVGPVAISPHGIGIALGYLIGGWVMLREGKKRGLSEDHVGTILLWALLGAIVGARFFYVLGHFSEFNSLGEMLAIWRGGISLVGGIFGAIAFAYPFMRKFNYRFLQVMDSAALGLALGIVIGRIGDLIIGDHLGTPTAFFLGFEYRGGNLPGFACVGQGTASTCTTTLPDGSHQVIAYGDVVHQTALYDFFISIGLFAILWWMNKKPRREGVLICTFAIVYGAGRIVTDFLRIDKTWLFGLTGSQWASVGVIVLAAFTLLRFARNPLPAGAPTEGEGSAEEEPEGGRVVGTPAQPGSRSDAENQPATTEFTPPPEPGSRDR